MRSDFHTHTLTWAHTPVSPARVVRDVPESVFTEAGFAQLQGVRGMQSASSLPIIQEIIEAMPVVHQITVGVLMAHLHRVWLSITICCIAGI